MRTELATAGAVIGAAVSIPLAILNIVAGIIGGIWLIVLGEWLKLAIGFAGFFLGSTILSLLLLKSYFAAYLLGKLGGVPFWQKVPTLISVFGYNFLLLSTWCIGVFALFFTHRQGSVWPYALWAYAVASWAWTPDIKNTAERVDPVDLIWASAAQFGSFALFVMLLFGKTAPVQLLWTFIAAAIFGMATAIATSIAAKAP